MTNLMTVTNRSRPHGPDGYGTVSKALLDEAVQRLTDEIPGSWPWEYATVRFSELGTLKAYECSVVCNPLDIRELFPDGIINQCFGALRRAMYAYPDGTWLTASLRVEPKGVYTAEFNYIDLPSELPVDETDLLVEGVSLPRPPRCQPSWWSRRG